MKKKPIINPINIPFQYDDEMEKTPWHKHIWLHPSMYIGKKGTGSLPNDGVYVLIKEVLDNAVDEFMSGYGKYIELYIDDIRKIIIVQDYGRGIPINQMVDAVTKMGFSSKSNSELFKKSIGVTPAGTGLKVVNAMSSYFYIRSYCNGRTKTITFSKGLEITETAEEDFNPLDNGTYIEFTPDKMLFGSYQIIPEYLIWLLKDYTFLNPGLTIAYNGDYYMSNNGLLDLLNENMQSPALYSPIHLKGKDIELAICHDSIANETYYGFVNGLYTGQNSVHLKAFKEAYVKTIREFFHKDCNASDILSFIVVAISIKVQEPLFTRAGKFVSDGKDANAVVRFITDFVQKELSDYLHCHPDVADIIRENIERIF